MIIRSDRYPFTAQPLGGRTLIIRTRCISAPALWWLKAGTATAEDFLHLSYTPRGPRRGGLEYILLIGDWDSSTQRLHFPHGHGRCLQEAMKADTVQHVTRKLAEMSGGTNMLFEMKPT